jgi:hypothetical protein
MGSMKVWDGSTWQTVSQQGPAGAPGAGSVASVDGRTGTVVLSDLYVNVTGDTMSGPLDMAKQEARNLVTQNLGSDPASPVAGQRYYHTTAKRERYWNGTQWVDDRGLFIQQSRAVNYTTDAFGVVNIGFATAFRIRDSVAVTVQNVTDQLAVYISVPHVNIETTYFLVRVLTSSGQHYANSLITLGYIAVGERP